MSEDTEKGQNFSCVGCQKTDKYDLIFVTVTEGVMICEECIEIANDILVESKDKNSPVSVAAAILADLMEVMMYRGSGKEQWAKDIITNHLTDWQERLKQTLSVERK